MTREVLYKYMGTNGVIETPVHLEDIYYVRIIKLTAAPGHMLTNGTKKTYSVKVPEEEESKWTEIKVN